MSKDIQGGSSWKSKTGQTHYESNKQYYVDKAKQYRKGIQDKIRKAKEAPCKDCKKEYPYFVMDFDHRDPSKKSFMIAQAYRNKGWKQIEAEIKKCDVVCANCHRIRTHSHLQT